MTKTTEITTVNFTDLGTTIEDLFEAGTPVHKHADPVDDGRENLTLAEAREVAREDASLLYIEAHDLEGKSFTNLRPIATSEFDAVIELVSPDFGEGQATVQTFGPFAIVWLDGAEDGPYWTGPSADLPLATYYIDGDAVSPDAEHVIEAFAAELQSRIPGLKFVVDNTVGNSPDAGQFMEMPVQAGMWEAALEEVFADRRYVVHAITEANSEGEWFGRWLNTFDNVAAAESFAKEVANEYYHGTVVMDNETGLVDYGNGWVEKSTWLEDNND